MELGISQAPSISSAVGMARISAILIFLKRQLEFIEPPISLPLLSFLRAIEGGVCYLLLGVRAYVCECVCMCTIITITVILKPSEKNFLGTGKPFTLISQICDSAHP